MLDTTRNVFYKLYKDRESLPEQVRKENSTILENWFNNRLYGIAMVYAAEAGISDVLAFQILLDYSAKMILGEK